MNQKTPLILLAIYIILFTVLAIDPYDRPVWWAENLPIMMIVVTLIILQRWFVFSPLAYGLMFVLIVLHTIGGHYTFSRVPFGFVTDLFGFERNHYDRMAHFTVGFYAYPIAEMVLRKRAVNSKWLLFLFPLFSIISVAAVYELFEWQFAILADPQAGAEVLGSQGDVWDAQKDILADTLGALAVMALFFWRNAGEIKEGIRKQKV